MPAHYSITKARMHSDAVLWPMPSPPKPQVGGKFQKILVGSSSFSSEAAISTTWQVLQQFFRFDCTLLCVFQQLRAYLEISTSFPVLELSLRRKSNRQHKNVMFFCLTVCRSWNQWRTQCGKQMCRNQKNTHIKTSSKAKHDENKEMQQCKHIRSKEAQKHIIQNHTAKASREKNTFGNLGVNGRKWKTHIAKSCGQDIQGETPRANPNSPAKWFVQGTQETTRGRQM